MLVLGSGANVSFNRIGLEHAGPQILPSDTRISDPDVTKRVTALGVWPSLILLAGSSVGSPSLKFAAAKDDRRSFVASYFT